MLTEQSNGRSASQERVPLHSSSLDAPKLIAYLESHDVTPILDYLIVLHLNPGNYGKNLRFEHIAQLAVSSIGEGSKQPNLLVFKQLIDEEYPYDVMEDIPINFLAQRWYSTAATMSPSPDFLFIVRNCFER